MPIYLDAEVAAIAKRVLTLYPLVKQYYTNLPEKFARPSVYFPVPINQASVFNNTRYKRNYSMSVKFFDDVVHGAKFENKALERARAVECDIMENRHLVQMVDSVGDFIDNYIRIKDIDIRETETGVVTMTFTWSSHYLYKVAAGDLMATLDVTATLKE